MTKGDDTMTETSSNYRVIGDASELGDNQINPYYLEDSKQRVAVARVDGRLYAFQDLCTHESCPLSAGLLTGTVLMCQCHGSQFELSDGAVLRGPAETPLRTYSVRELDGKLEIAP